MPKVGQKIVQSVSPVIVEEEYDPWTPLKISVIVKDSREPGMSKRVVVYGIGLGSMGVYSCRKIDPMFEDLYELLLVNPKGISEFHICATVKEADAKRIGDYLWSNFCLAFKEPDRKGIVEKLPKWVPEWVKACNTKLGWVDPKLVSDR